MTTRYLHVIQTMNPTLGGPGEGIKQLASASLRMGHEVEIATLDSPQAPWSGELACPVHFLGPSYLNYGYAPRFSDWLRSNIARFGAVIIHGIWQYCSFATWRVWRETAAIPYFVFPHGMLDPWFRHRYPLKHLKKMLYWPWADYRVLRDARGVLFTCEEERLLARQSFSRYSAAERVVSFGTRDLGGDPDVQRELFLREFPQLRDRRLLLFLSRVHPKKGCDLLVEAFAGVAPCDDSLRLVIAGPDQVGLRPALTRMAQRLGVADRIVWTGMLRGDVKAGAFRAAEAFVLPSHQENFGIAVTEALACGVPVLISNKVNIWREVLADHAGLAADDTLTGTQQLLRSWLDLAPAERARMAAAASQCFQRRFHIDAVAKGLFSVIGEQSADGRGFQAA